MGTVAADASPAPAGSKKKEHLITDEGFSIKLALNLLVIGSVATSCYRIQPIYELGFELYGWANEQMMVAAHRMAWWSLLGLLSSSCCALQIILNTFSFGCAGFNTTLGPLRPTFVALTLVIQGVAWFVAYPRPWQWAPTAASTALATSLTLMPEALSVHTKWREQRQQKDLDRQATAAATALYFRLSTLGCAACVSKVSGVLNGMPQVSAHKVSLEDGLATVHVRSDDGKSRAEQHQFIAAKLEAAGFPATALPDMPAQSGAQQDEACCSSSNAGGGTGDAAADWARENSFSSAIVAGLLSSSCCLLQLALNALAVLNVAHVGCAGFNKVLGPWRPQLRVATVGWLSTMWVLSIRKGWPKRPLAFSTILAVCLAWLPEILLLLGEGGSLSSALGGALDSLGLPGADLLPQLSGVAASYDGAEVVSLKVNGMGCEACQLHVRTTLEMASGVLSSRVDWSAGTAEVWVNRAWGFNLSHVSTKLAVDGYEILDPPELELAATPTAGEAAAAAASRKQEL